MSHPPTLPHPWMPAPEAVQAALDRLEALAQRFSGVLGVAASPWPTEAADSPHLARLADEPFHPASTIKVPIMVEVFRQAEQGRLQLGQRIPLPAAGRATGSGVLKDLDPGLPLTVLDLVTLMITVSDNTATNLLIDLVGRDQVNATLAELGLRSTYLAGKLQVPPEQQTPEQRQGRRSVTTPRDLWRLMVLIARGEAASPESCQKMIDILRRQQYTEVLGRYLPYDPDAVEEGDLGSWPVVIASKGGAIRGVRNEVGLIQAGPRGYVVAICTKGCQDPRFHVDNEGSLAVAQVSRLLFDLYAGA